MKPIYLKVSNGDTLVIDADKVVSLVTESDYADYTVVSTVGYEYYVSETLSEILEKISEAEDLKTS